MESKPKLGRSQRIVIVALSMPFIMSCVYVFTGQLTGMEWTDFIKVFFPAVVGPYLLASAGTKAAKAYTETPKDAKPEKPKRVRK